MFLTTFAQIFLSGHTTYIEQMSCITKAVPQGSPDVHYPVAAEGLLSLDLQLLGKLGELLLFLLDQAWEQRGGPTLETQRSVAL